MMTRTIFIVLLITAAVQAQEKQSTTKADIRYVAIGDSYSIGEGAAKTESWPAVLTRHLKDKGISIELVANPSVTGWTTLNAIERELPVFLESKPDFATLQIGVNDWVQDVDKRVFQQRLSFLMDRMLAVLPSKKRLLVVNIPDFGVTPTGKNYARGRNISDGIRGFNRIISQECTRRGVSLVDIFELSRKMGAERSLIATDGLHPSAREYAEWEKIIFPVALELLK